MVERRSKNILVLVRIDLHVKAGKVVVTRFLFHYFRFSKNFTKASTLGPMNRITGTTIPYAMAQDFSQIKRN